MKNTPKWQRKLEVLDLYMKHYCNRLCVTAKEILDDPELPEDQRPLIENFYKAAVVAVAQTYKSPIYPELMKRLIKDIDEQGKSELC